MPLNLLNRYRHHDIGKGQTVFEIRINDATVAALEPLTLSDFAVELDALLDEFFGSLEA